MASQEIDLGKLNESVLDLHDHVTEVVLEHYKALQTSEAHKKDLVKELKQSEAQNKELKNELMQREGQHKELKKELEQTEARYQELKKYPGKKELKKKLELIEVLNNELKKELEQSEGQKKRLKQDLQQREAEKKGLKNDLLQEEAENKDLKKDLLRTKAENIELKKDLTEKEKQLRQLTDRATEHNNTDETVAWLKEERKKLQSEEVKLLEKISILKKQRETFLKHIDELEVKNNEIQGKLKETEEDLERNKALNCAVIVTEHEKNAELQEARKVLILGLSDLTTSTYIGVKRMGELDKNDPRSTDPEQELWNFKEERKAMLAEGISQVLDLWKPKKRTRRSFK